MFRLPNHLKKYQPKNLKKTKSKEEALTNAEIYNNRDNVIKAFENRVFPFSDGFQKKESVMSDKSLSDWVKVGKKRFDRIKNQIQNAKNNNLEAKPERGSPIYFDKSYKVIQDIEHSKITHEETLKIIIGIRNDIKRINDLDKINPNQVKVLNALLTVDEAFTGEQKKIKKIKKKKKKKHLPISRNAHCPLSTHFCLCC